MGRGGVGRGGHPRLPAQPTPEAALMTRITGAAEPEELFRFYFFYKGGGGEGGGADEVKEGRKGYLLSATDIKMCTGICLGDVPVIQSFNPFTAPSPYNFWAEKSTHMPADSIFSGPVSNKSTSNIVLTEIFSDGKARTKKGVRISNFALLSFVFK